MTPPTELWFLRTGRTRRGRGYPMETDTTTGAIKVRAAWPYRQPIWITVEEIEAGEKTATKKQA